ncbi:MAG: sigma-70 family RNA polymerase sigma factor, partial [Acidobacteria bacterium]|nr:sigma-70 family RNA polymerase sigma factor [Acidobacteriota bacterium]
MLERPPDDQRSLVGRLYDCYGASLYRYAVLLLADPVAAEDAVQQVFAAILRTGVCLDSEAHYLRRAVRNECYSMLRRGRVRREVIGGEALIEPVIAGGVEPAERMALERAIRDLPPEQREVLHLHAFEGWTFQEIADASEAPVNTVAARYR